VLAVVDLETKETFKPAYGCQKFFLLPCGIGGDFADLGLEFGVERGDCVW
jgi:hypothetical protein